MKVVFGTIRYVVAICCGLSTVAMSQSTELIMQSGHAGFVTSVVFSPDGKVLGSCSWDSTIKLWEVATGRELRTLSGHLNEVTSGAFSPDGKILASSAGDRTVRLWDVATGRVLRILTGHSSRLVHSVAFSPNGNELASGSEDRTIKIWDVETGRELRTFSGHSGGVLSIAFSPDGKVLASVSFDKTVKLWDVKTGRELRILSGHSASVNSVAFSPDGKILASGGGDNTIRLWDAATGRILRILSGQLNSVNSVAFSPDGKVLASGGDGGTIRLWEADTGRELRTIGGYSSSGVSSVAFSPNGSILASGGRDRRIKLWEVTTSRELRTFFGHIYGIYSTSFSPDGKVLAISGGDKVIELWDLAAGSRSRALSGHSDNVNSVAFSPDGKALASGSADKTVKLWEVATGRVMRTLSGHVGVVNSVVFSPDGTILATGGEDGLVKLWDVETGRELRSLSEKTGSVTSVAFSPDRQALAIGRRGEMIQLWHVETGTLLRTFSTDSSDTTTLAFSPDGRILASGNKYGMTRLWGVTGHLLGSFYGHDNNVTSVMFSVTSVAFSPDGKVLASGYGNKTIKLWDVAAGRELYTLAGHLSIVFSVSFSPDGKILASGSRDQSIRLWQVTTGRPIATLLPLEGDEWAIIDADGRFDASPGGMKNMHYSAGRTTFALEQMKSVYWHPNLLAMLLGYSEGTLREVPPSAYAKPAPEVEAKVDDGTGRLRINLTNQGGGLGRVEVFVNEKQYQKDARIGLQIDPKAPSASLEVDLLGANNVIPGEINTVQVIAWNVSEAGGYISSPKFNEKWNAPGMIDKRPQRLFAVIGGISRYSGADSMNLSFPTRDAREIAEFLRRGARLFDEAKITLLTSDAQPNASQVGVKEMLPTKANFKLAFNEIADQARPQDVLVVFLAGHGISLSLNNSEYGYLTWEANTLDKEAFINDLARDQQLILGSEFVDWNLKIRVNKRVMVFDTCEAGAATKALLALIRARSSDSDRIRAQEQMRDLTGMHVLMGASANKSAYESSSYGHSYLTRALMEGFTGPGLDETKSVDVHNLFGYAEKRVKEMTESSIKQVPEYTRVEQRFPIGLLESKDLDYLKGEIAKDRAKPHLLPPVLFEPGGADDLKLTEALRGKLRSLSDLRQINAVYIELQDIAEAIHLRGSYTVTGDHVDVRLGVIKNGQKITEISANGSKTNTDSILLQLMEGIDREIEKLLNR